MLKWSFESLLLILNFILSVCFSNVLSFCGALNLDVASPSSFEATLLVVCLTACHA